MPLIRNVNSTPTKPVEMQGVSGVRMAVMAGREDGVPNFAMRHFQVEPNGHAPHHSHDYEHEVYVLEGNGTVLLEGTRHPIKAGDVVYVPADEEHQFRAGDKGMRFLCLVPVSRNCGEATPGS